MAHWLRVMHDGDKAWHLRPLWSSGRKVFQAQNRYGYARRSHRGNSWAMSGASGRSFGSSWPTAVWSCIRASRLDMSPRGNRRERTGWSRWCGLALLERTAAKPEREAKQESVVVPWFARVGLESVGMCLIDTNKIDEFRRSVDDSIQCCL